MVSNDNYCVRVCGTKGAYRNEPELHVEIRPRVVFQSEEGLVDGAAMGANSRECTG